MAETSTHTDNILIGSGRLYLDILDDSDATQGERDLGDAVGATLTVTTERAQVFSGSGPIARQIVNKVRSLTRSLGMTLHDVSLDNLALFVGGSDPAVEADVATAVISGTAEALTVRRGRWYQLGVSAIRPAGVRAVHDVAATGKAAGDHDAGSRSVVLTTAKSSATSGNTIARAENYVVDAEHGRIFIRANATSADLADDSRVFAHYTPVAAATRRQVATPATPRVIRAAVRYIEDTRTGTGRNFYAPLCSVSAAGEMALMSRDTEQQITLTAEILEPGGGKAALLIDEQAA